MRKYSFFNRKSWITFFSFSGIFVFLVFLIFSQCKVLAINEAEKSLANFLLNHKAIHHFVEEVQKPEIYRLKSENALYQEYFSPKSLSFTFIARNIKDALNVEREKKGLDPIYFKLASPNPRNVINSADEHELRLLRDFNAGVLQEFKKVTISEQEKKLYYALPISPNKQSCMRCHGDPADAPREMVDHYGDRAGFHEKLGEIRALISVRVPMAGLMQDANRTAYILSFATFLLLSAAFSLVLYFFHKMDVQKDLAVEQTYYLNSILQSSSDTAIVATNLNFDVKYFNDAAAQLFGVPASLALTANIKKLHASKNVQSQRFNQAIAQVKEQGSHDFILQHNGKSLEAHVSAIKDNMGNCAGFLLLAHDITGRIAAEKQQVAMNERLQKAEKMESIGLMAGGVAHDLNNILSGITGYPELLLLQLPEDSELRKPIEEIQKSGQRATAVVADLLTVARGVASTRKPTNLNSLIEEYLKSPEYRHLLSHYPQIECHAELGVGLPNISCSPVHVQKCIMNMTMNAMEAIDGRGNVILSTSTFIADKIWAEKHGLKQAEYVVLSISDTGGGITEEDQKNIFEPFYSRKVMGRSGTGLGLTVVWNTMKEHEGTVTVSSDEKGSTFTLYFPATRDAVVQATLVEEKVKGTEKKETVLVVDDEFQLRDVASRMLKTLGYKVECVCSGEEAVAYLQKNKVDLVLLDMMMEPGINGRQTYEQIVKLYPGQKAIVVSGYAESDEVKITLGLGAGGFIKKPYSMSELNGVVNKVLNA